MPKENTALKQNVISALRLIPVVLILISAITNASDKTQWAKDHGYSSPQDPGGPGFLLQAGGPDPFGYYYYDSHETATNAPHYLWRDIARVGILVNLTEDDQVLGPFPLGFSFDYYGQNVSQYYVCSNGWISFTSPDADYFNRPLPTPDQPNNLLAVFWDDLRPDSGLAYRYTNNADTCIVSWNNFKRYDGIGRYSFEVIIVRGFGILFQYRALSGTLNSHSIGIENITGTIGLQYVYNTDRNETGTAIYFGPRPPHYVSRDVSPNTFIAPTARGQVNDSIVPVIRYINSGSVIENFNGRVRITHSGDLYNQTVSISNLRPDSAVNIVFPSFTPHEPGSYQLRATSEQPMDMRHSNDTIIAVYTAFTDIYWTDFDSGWSSFRGTNDWNWGVPRNGPDTAHSGVYLWATGLTRPYTVGPLLSTLYSDTLVLDSTATLSFWHWYDTEALFDGGNVKISTDDGISWELLQPDGGYDGILSDVFFNPIGGEEAFFGSSGEWVLANFNLNQYGDQTVLIKFDFGSDNSTVADGWFIDDFTVLGAHESSPGWISGNVRDLDSLRAIPNVVVQAGNRSTTTDNSGFYLLEMLPEVYSLSAAVAHFASDTIAGITVIDGDTTVFDFALAPLQLSVDTSAIDTTLSEQQTAVFTRLLQNPSAGPVGYSVRVDYGLGSFSLMRKSNSQNLVLPEQTFDFGDELFTFDPQTPTDDINCIGVEFDGGYFWVTGRHGSDEIHKLYKFDRQGNLAASFNQNTFSTWGWRDLAYDGTYLYSSDENELAIIDPDSGQKIGEMPHPISIPFPLRALAYDPATDHFWAANFTSDIIEFDRTAATLHSYPNDRHIFGLAWDDASPDGPWLWVFSQDGVHLTQVSQFDPRLGHFTGIEFDALDHNGGISDLAQGACFTTRWEPSKGVFFGMVNGRTTLFDSYDLVQGYEITSVPRWLTVEPSQGTLQSLQSQPLEITIAFPDSSFVPDSVFEAIIIIENDGPANLSIPIRVGLRSGIENNDPEIPKSFILYQNYPNPFNSSTQIKFGIPYAGEIKLEVFNILGQKIATLLDADIEAGIHSVIWNAPNLPSGIYYYHFSASQFSKTGRLTLLK